MNLLLLQYSLILFAHMFSAFVCLEMFEDISHSHRSSCLGSTNPKQCRTNLGKLDKPDMDGNELCQRICSVGHEV